MAESIIQELVWDSSCLSVCNAAGENVPLLSLRYNAAINALELRGLAPRRDLAPTKDGIPLKDQVGRGPLKMRLAHPAMASSSMCVVHFETATLGFPFECDCADPRWRDRETGTAIVQEVVILRGLRVEME